MADPELVQTFRFRVSMTDSVGGDPGQASLGNGQFAECSGLQLEADVREYFEGGRNDGVVRRVGRVKLSPIVLKRGMFVTSSGGSADDALWQWLIAMVQGTLPIPRYNGLIEVLNTQGTRTVASWSFDRGLPVKVSGPSLNAKTGEIAIEELHIAHEGLRVGAP